MKKIYTVFTAMTPEDHYTLDLMHMACKAECDAAHWQAVLVQGNDILERATLERWYAEGIKTAQFYRKTVFDYYMNKYAKYSKSVQYSAARSHYYALKNVINPEDDIE